MRIKGHGLICVIVSMAVLTGCAGVPLHPDRIDMSAYHPRADVAAFEQPAGWQTNAVKNVIFMIGDGMGLGHIWLSQVMAVGPSGRLYLEGLPVSGIVTTFSASNLRTDSAAAATALATGNKTANGVIGQLPDGVRLKNLMERAEERQMATGIVVTKAVTDATPAGFGAHNASRGNQTAIAADMLGQGFEVLFGGGSKYWIPKAAGGVRTDGRDLTSEAVQKGYRYIAGTDDLRNLQTTPALGLFAKGVMQENDREPSLAAMTAKAIELLHQNDRGFLLMVEGSQIDTYAHTHKRAEMVRRVLNFDMAVREAVEFARRDGHTLVIVTADHETGGLVVQDGVKEAQTSWSTWNHSSLPVAVFAYGPGALNFTGMLDNTQIPRHIARLLGMEP